MGKIKKIIQINKVLKENYHELQDTFKVKEIGIFGSYARNEQKAKSDVDILVEFREEPSLFKFIRLEDYLNKILSIKVDLVMKSALKPEIGKRILSEVTYL